MSGVSSLAYLGLTSSDLPAWETFGRDVLGMQLVEAPDAPGLRFRMDDREHRLTIEQGEGGLAFLGFEVADEASFDEVAARLDAGGVGTKEATELATQRQVRRLVQCDDPAGNPIEIVFGHGLAKSPFVSPRGVRFVTGQGGMGHVAMLVPDKAQADDFYLGLLGFRPTDTISTGPATIYFNHCNQRHHTFAYVPFPGTPARLAHFMVEVDSLESVGRAWDLVEAGGAPPAATLGMHTNDHMVSFYAVTPSGVEVEYGFAGRVIDDATWRVGHYTAGSYWGHKRAGANPRPS